MLTATKRVTQLLCGPQAKDRQKEQQPAGSASTLSPPPIALSLHSFPSLPSSCDHFPFIAAMDCTPNIFQVLGHQWATAVCDWEKVWPSVRWDMG
mmetsp:Transcript_64306/g.107667  ORF Transcript_64306/g.107667 Transcript_64306/m.107667 type:complete len:95 (-) Transcript_64306:389-673(-)